MYYKYIIIFIFCTSQLFPQQFEIKSLKVYAGNDETSFPVILSNGQKQITIDFDIKSGFTPDFDIVFRFCDHNWIPYKNLFLQNQGKCIAYRPDVVRLPSNITGAEYHFSGSFPDERGYVSFPFSGKWKFFITDPGDTSIVYAEGKFYVVQQDVAIQDSLKNEQLEDKNYFPADLAKVFNITTNFVLPDSFFPSYVDHIEIIENHKLQYPVIVDRSFNTNTRQFYWNGDRKFSFVARDVLPGNEYRQTDLRNTNVFISKNVNAHLDQIDYSRFFTHGKPDLDGASVLTFYNDDYADYLNVTFRMRPSANINDDVYLVGAFNNWAIQPSYKMDLSDGIYSITIPLKRGIYDYQYVIADLNNGRLNKADWVTIEGNDWRTSNIYNIFLYYSDTNYGGYDRIIGYKQIISE